MVMPMVLDRMILQPSSPGPASVCGGFHRLLLQPRPTRSSSSTVMLSNRSSSKTWFTNSQNCLSTKSSLSNSPTATDSTRYSSSEAPQRSEEWFALRKDRLTTSTFSTALGFWYPNRRSELWREKVYPSEPALFNSSAKAAMSWGVTHEDIAIEHYKLVTGRDVSSLGFAVHSDAQYSWLGASPDGVLDYDQGGILEVKCPFNKGKPEDGVPWKAVPYYYMPQIQGLMEIMDRNWVDLYCWTPSGSSLFRVRRTPEYFWDMHEILKEFWWESVVPAREVVVAGGGDVDVQVFKPKARHELTGLLISKSRKLAAEAELIYKTLGAGV